MFNELEQEVILSTTETNVAQNASVIGSVVCDNYIFL